MKAYSYKVNGQQVVITDCGDFGVTVSGHQDWYDSLEEAQYYAGVSGLKPEKEVVYPD